MAVVLCTKNDRTPDSYAKFNARLGIAAVSDLYGE
jgi:hypothetical protein